jgi:hypothetical protein
MTGGLAERVAAQLRTHLPLARTFPVDVEGLARQLGVNEILRVDDLVEDGRLERRDGHVRVLLAARSNRQRQRYTLAHEIGHLLLADPDRDTIARRMKTDDEVERFCDGFAAALLLPRDIINADYRAMPRTLAVLRRIAEQSDTSLAAATVRLHEVAGWPQALLHWKRSDRGWTYRWGAAVPMTYHRRLRSAPDTSARLDDLALRSRSDQEAEITMRVGPAVIRLDGEISVRGRSAVGLIAFPRLP